MRKKQKIERNHRKRRLVIYITDDLWDKLQKASAEKDHAVSQYAFDALNQHFVDKE